MWVEQRPFQVATVRFPGSDVGGVELEDAKADVAGEHWVLGFDLLCGAAEAFFGEFGDSSSDLPSPSQKLAATLCSTAFGIKRLRKLNENGSALTTDLPRFRSKTSIRDVVPDTGKEIEDNRFLVLRTATYRSASILFSKRGALL